MKVEELIAYAFKKVGFVFSEENLRAAYEAEALYYLNEEISSLNRSGNTCAYFTEVDFTMVPAQQDYTFGLTESDVTTEPFTEVEFVHILWDGVNYSLSPETRKLRLGSTTFPQPYDAIPGEVLVKRNLTQAILSFYQIPNLALPCKVYGKQEISKFVQYQDITNVPEYYLKYLLYVCAKEIAGQYVGTTWTDVDEMSLEKARNDVFSAPELDVGIINTPALLNSTNNAIGLASIYGSI